MLVGEGEEEKEREEGECVCVMSVREEDGVKGLEALALMDALVLDRGGTLTEDRPHLCKVVMGAGEDELGVVKEDEGRGNGRLKVLLQRPVRPVSSSLSPLVGGGSKKEEEAQRQQKAAARLEQEREVLLQMLQSWLLTSTLGDDATRREHSSRRRRFWAKQHQVTAATATHAPGHLQTHTHKEEEEEEEEDDLLSSPLGARNALAKLLESMLNLDKEWGGLSPFDQAFLSALASLNITHTTTTGSGGGGSGNGGGGSSHTHTHPSQQPRSLLSPPPPPSSLLPSPITTTTPFPPHDHHTGIQLTPPRTPTLTHTHTHTHHHVVAPLKGATSLPPVLLSMLLAKIRGDARLVSYAPYDAAVGFEARTYTHTHTQTQTQTQKEKVEEEGSVCVYKTYFRATPEVLLEGCVDVVSCGGKGEGEGGEEKKKATTKKKDNKKNTHSTIDTHTNTPPTTTTTSPLTPALRAQLHATLTRLGTAGYTLIGLASKEEGPTYEATLTKAREEMQSSLPPSPRRMARVRQQQLMLQV
jgi:hypothetical protein